MDQEILQKFEEQSQKLEQVYRSVEKTRKYFLWTMIISVVVIVLPLIGLIFAIPQFLNLYTGAGLDNLGL
jgi:type IV secretory pathway component VirB8